MKKIKRNSKGRKHSGSPERLESQRTLLALPGALGEEELVLFVGEICREESVHHGAETRGVEKGSFDRNLTRRAAQHLCV